MSRTLHILSLFVAISVLCLQAVSVSAAGFSRGNDIRTTMVSGMVTAYCPAANGIGTDMRLVSCRAQLWEPQITDYFVGPQVDADQVTLQATRADGSQRTKDSAYDGEKGRSRSRFNLGISTLTQKPLLKEGLNNVSYILSKNNQSVEDGQFEVKVTPQPALTCSHGTYQGFGPFDCQDQTHICNRYFNQCLN